MKIKKIKLTNKGLLSFFILQFFFFQIIKMSINPVENGYFPLIIKLKFYFNSVFGSFKFSVGDILYSILAAFLLYWMVRGIILVVKKKKDKAKSYSIKILLTLNILYMLFMLSFGILYDYKNFPQYENPKEKLYINDLKTVAGHLLNDCIDLRENVSTNKLGEFSINRSDMIDKLYLEQSVFYTMPIQKSNVKKSLFSPIIKRIGILGYYNPFTGEAQIVEGIPDTSIPFILAHEMGHQAGVTREDEANFYSFYMGESSPNKEYQYSVKYKAMIYVLREIYANDSIYVKRALDNFSPGMKKDRDSEKKYYSQMFILGSDVFSQMNDAYLRSNNQDGVIAYDYVVKMIVSFYRKNYPSLFNTEKPEPLK